MIPKSYTICIEYKSFVQKYYLLIKNNFSASSTESCQNKSYGDIFTHSSNFLLASPCLSVNKQSTNKQHKHIFHHLSSQYQQFT